MAEKVTKNKGSQMGPKKIFEKSCFTTLGLKYYLFRDYDHN